MIPNEYTTSNFFRLNSMILYFRFTAFIIHQRRFRTTIFYGLNRNSAKTTHKYTRKYFIIIRLRERRPWWSLHYATSSTIPGESRWKGDSVHEKMKISTEEWPRKISRQIAPWKINMRRRLSERLREEEILRTKGWSPSWYLGTLEVYGVSDAVVFLFKISSRKRPDLWVGGHSCP